MYLVWGFFANNLPDSQYCNATFYIQGSSIFEEESSAVTANGHLATSNVNILYNAEKILSLTKFKRLHFKLKATHISNSRYISDC